MSSSPSGGGLCLEDCLEDSPQTRALIGVYEQDSTIFLEFIQSLRDSYQEIASIQNKLANATNSLSSKLKQFSNLSFSLNLGAENLGSTINMLAVKVDEIAMINKITHGELIENLNGPLSRFGDQDFEEFYRLKTNFHSSDKLHEDAAARLARVPKKKNNEKSWKEATDQLYAARKAFHNTSMLYCSCLNSLQKKKEIGMLQPVISLLKSQISYSVLSEDHRPEWSRNVDEISVYIDKLKSEVDDSRQVSLKSIDCLDAASTRAYIPDPPTSLDFPEIPVNKTKTQISAYLFYRSRGNMLLSQWSRNYFFTQGGNLMQQSKNDYGGQLCIDLEGCSVTPIDTDDRRYVFQVTNRKQTVVLQAESKHQLEEWIATLTNVSNSLKSQRNEQKSSNNLDGSTSASVSASGEQVQEEKKLSTSELLASKLKPDSLLNSSSGSMFNRLKQVASSLVSPSGDSNKPTEIQQQQVEEVHHQQQHNISRNSGSHLQDFMTANSNIIFNLPKIGRLVHKEEMKTTAAVDVESSSKDETKVDVDGKAETSANNLLPDSYTSSFTCHFLGCKQMSSNEVEEHIDETIWKIMTARALQKIMNTIEVIITITTDESDGHTICLLNANDKSVLKVLEISTIGQACCHGENPRLFGFNSTLQQLEGEVISCHYCFESSNGADGNEICCAINSAKAMHQSKVEYDEEQEKEKKLQQNPTESSASPAAPPSDEKQLELRS